MKRLRLKLFGAAFCAFSFLILWPVPGFFLEKSQESSRAERADKNSFVVAVPANAAWTDTRLEVNAGQEIAFRATGRITLQVGNPQAECRPSGYDLRTVQQPLQEENLGALIGKVVISLTVTVDEETGEEKREEIARIFFIGAERELEMPASGRLFLGINENVIGDNAGEFLVTILTKD